MLERAVKGVTHDKHSISVAPPKLYAKRFLEFTTKRVFMSQAEFSEMRQQQAAEGVNFADQLLPVDLTSGVQQQPPWALPPIATGIARPTSAAPLTDATEQYQAAVDSSGSKGLPLATEDSFPYPPGQLESAAAEPATASVAGADGEVPAASSVAAAQHTAEGLAVFEPPLLELLAAPIGLDLTSPLAHAAFNGSDPAGRLISAEQVSVTVVQDGGVDGVIEQLAAEPAQDAVLVPAVVIEKVPSLKQLSLERQSCDSKVSAKGSGMQQQQQGSPGVILARG